MTTSKIKPRAAPPSGQLHTDFGILTQRVTTMEDAFHTVASDVATLRRENREAFEGLAKDLGNRITLQAAKPTDWRSIIGLMLTSFAIAGSFWAYTKSEENSNVARIETMIVAESIERKSDIGHVDEVMRPILSAVAQHANDAKRFDTLDSELAALRRDEWPMVAQLEYEKRIDGEIAIRHEYNQRDMKRIEDNLGVVAADQIKRPEIAASNKALEDRLDALARAENATEAQLHTGWSIVDTVRSLETRFENLRAQVSSPLIQNSPPTK